MASPLEILAAAHAAQNPQRRVVVYSPGRQVPVAQRQPSPPQRTGGRRTTAPPSRTQAVQRSAGPVDWSAEFDKVMNSPAAQKQRQEQAQQQAENQAWDQTPWYKKGLGIALGNPVSKAVLTPIDWVFGTAQRSGVLGAETAARIEHKIDNPYVTGAVNLIPGFGQLINAIDIDQANKDTRSPWEKVKPGSTYGYGELLNQENPEWVNRVGGFIGDVAFDPTMYITGGATRVGGALEKSGKLAEAARALEESRALARAAKATEGLEEIAPRGAKLGETAQRGLELVIESNRKDAEARRLFEEASQIPQREMPLHQGRKAREAFLGEIAEKAPHLYEQYGPELARAGERGFNTIRDPALREAIGLGEPALGFGIGEAAIELPHTGRIVQRTADITGALRALANDTPLLGKAMEKFATKGTEEASRILSRGAKGDAFEAASHIRLHNLLRQGKNVFEGRGNRMLTTFIREFKGKGGESELRQLFHDAEAKAGESNRVNQFFGHDLPDLYEHVTGRKMLGDAPHVNPDTYVPHLMTPEFKRFLNAHLQDKSVEEYMKAAKFTSDDLLESSHNLDKARQLKPETVGVAKDFKVGDRTITLKDGTIEELNDQLKQAFPEFKGKAYMDDPAKIGEAYVSSVSRQAGRDFALDRMLASKSPFMHEMTGEKWDAIVKRNEWARTNPVVEQVKKGFVAGQRAGVIPAKGEEPTSKWDQLFGWTKAYDATQQQRDYLIKNGHQYTEAIGKDVTATRSTLADNLKDLRSQLMDGLKRKEKEADTQIKRINLVLDKVDAEIKKVGPLNSENVDDLVGLSHTVRAQISDTEDAIKEITDRYGKQIPRDQRRIRTELDKTLRRLNDQEAKLEAQYLKGSSEMKAEAARRRKILQEPVDKAEEAVRQAEAAHPRYVSKERVQEANAYIRSNFNSEDRFAAERQLYVDALNHMREQGIPIYRTVDGKLTQETTDAVKEIVAESREITPMPPDVPTPSPEATVQATAPEPIRSAAPPDVQAQLRQKMEEARARQATEQAVPDVPKAAPPAEDLMAQRQDLTNRFRDAVEAGDDETADSIEDELNRVEEQIRAGGGPEAGAEPVARVPAEEPPPAPTLDTTLKRQPDGSFASDDGFAMEKAGKEWRVTFDDGNYDFGTFKTQKEAKDEIEHQRSFMAEPEPAPTPEAPTPSEPEPAAAKSPTKRITRRWTTKEVPGVGEETRSVAALTGPDEGWTVEPFMAAPPHQRGEPFRYMPEGGLGPRQPTAPLGLPEGPGPTRWMAFNQHDDGLRSVTFASEREAKLAVEDYLRKQRYRSTTQDILARSNMAEPQTFTTVESLTNARQFPPSTLTPEEAAANIEASRAVPTLPQGRRTVEQPVPPDLALTQEGADLLAQRPAGRARNYDEYNQAYREWQAKKAEALDPSLTQAQRNKAAREAKSMGGQFTTKGGKYYERHAAESVIANDVARETAMNEDPKVIAARAARDKADANARSQVESMVYLKHHNPVTGDDELARLPSGSMLGFGSGEERVPVPIEPPTTGTTVNDIRAEQPRDVRPGIPQGQRDADRQLLDSGVSMLMPGEVRQQYDAFSKRADEITQRLEASVENERNLRSLNDATKATYTEDVKAAEDSVREAQRAEERAYLDMTKGHRNMTESEARAAYDRAVEASRRAEFAANQVRNGWMNADRAYKQALEHRDEYLKAAGDVTRAEQAIHGSTRAGDALIADVRAGTLPKDLRVGGYPASEEYKKLARNLRQADQKLQVMEDAGVVYLTDAQRRDLQGVLNDIDVEQRNLINQTMQDKVVTPGTELLPRTDPVEEALRAGYNPGSFVERFGNEPAGTRIPPTMGTGDELKARAFAESLEPTEPAQRQVFSLSEQGAPQRTTELRGRQPYAPGTEREAIANLERQAHDIEAGPVGQEFRQQRENIAAERQVATDTAADARREVKRIAEQERDETLLPIRDRAQTLTQVDAALNEKAKFIPQREEARAQRKVIVDNKVTKKMDVVKVADDIEKVARQNPELLDKDLATVEGILQDARQEADRLTENDLTSKQVQGAIDAVANPNDKTLDIMLTTVGQNWKMLYDATGGKEALLQEGDIILSRNLHKSFTNLYEQTRDRVLFGRTFNAITNLFKTYATLTPGFHMRNALSGIFMNSIDGVPMATQLAGAQLWKQYMDGGEEWLKNVEHYKGFTGDEIRAAFDATHGSGAGGRFTEPGFAEITEHNRITDRMEKLTRNKATRWSQRVGERVEGSLRLGMALDSVKAGDDVTSAIQRINRIHFDYGEISSFDEKMKRIVPFWTFASRNLPMQVSEMWTHPRGYRLYENFVANFRSDDEEYTPAYWTKAGAWNTGLKIPKTNIPILRDAGGLPIYVMPDTGYSRIQQDFQDFEDFLSLKRPGAVLSQANPLFSAPVEFATRKDIFTGQSFEPGETTPASGITNLPLQALARIFGQEKGGEVDAAFANAYRALNPLADRTSRLLPSDDQGKQRRLESILRIGAGAPVRTLTPKQQQNEYFNRYYTQRDAMKRELERLQRKAG